MKRIVNLTLTFLPGETYASEDITIPGCQNLSFLATVAFNGK